MESMTVDALARMIDRARPLLLLDVRREAARRESGARIAGAVWRDPARWLDWKDDVAPTPTVVVYCAHGREISQGLTAALRAMGVEAVHLEGGFERWRALGRPVEALDPAP